jgi:hypothetical protein
MGILPFVNQNGRRVIRWPRLVLAWIFLMLGTVLGNGVAGYFLTGDWWHFDIGIWFGLFGCASLTVYGLKTPVEKLPAVP